MENAESPERLIFKLLYVLRRHTDKWAILHLPTLTSRDFSITYMPYFMNIGHSGISNHDLVNKIKVTKQGVSKIVKELESLGLVSTAKSETDARSNMIFLTEEGRKLYEAVNQMGRELTEEYIALIGAKKYDQFIDTFIKLSEWHEDKEKLQ
jgi:DNA-binding MarR family transcriptional regulator